MPENNIASSRPIIDRQYFLGVPFDRIAFNDVVELIRETRALSGFRYIVTPNVDHVVRLSRKPDLKILYEHAWLTLCDSKPVVLLARLMPMILPRVTGADLTKSLFSLVIREGDRIAIVAPSQAVVQQMRKKYPQLHIRAHVPPYGILDNPVELQRCVDFVADEPADFIFLAIGSPQSEKIAYEIARGGRATGTCLCIGAALEFMTGMKKRSPRWMSRVGLEWLHRLASDPKRLWRRYIFSVPPLIALAVPDILRSWAGRGRASR